MNSHPISQLRIFYTLAAKEWVRCIRVWPQTFLPSAITSSLYFFIFGVVLGQHIGDMADIPYAQFIVPGFMMTSMILNTYMNVSHSLFGERYQHAHEEYVSSPMSAGTLMAGFIAGGCLRGTVVGFLIYGVAFIMTGIVPQHLIAMFAMAFLTQLLFAALGVINALLAKKFDDISVVPSFILTPLTYLGGVFYAAEALPDRWQIICHLNPIYHLISSFRYCMLGEPHEAILVSFGVTLLCAATALLTAYAMARKGVGLQY